MRILVKTKTGQKEDKVTPPPLRLVPEVEEYFVVSVRERPVEGRANESVAKLLSKHFGVSRSQVKLVRGATSKLKIFEINS